MSENEIRAGSLRATWVEFTDGQEGWALVATAPPRETCIYASHADAVLFARKILEREGAVVLEGEHATAFRKGRKLGFSTAVDPYCGLSPASAYELGRSDERALHRSQPT